MSRVILPLKSFVTVKGLTDSPAPVTVLKRMCWPNNPSATDFAKRVAFMPWWIGLILNAFSFQILPRSGQGNELQKPILRLRLETDFLLSISPANGFRV